MTQPSCPGLLGTAWLGTLPRSAWLLALPKLRGSDPFSFGHYNPWWLQGLSVRPRSCHVLAHGLAAGGTLLAPGSNIHYKKGICK